MLNKQKGFTLAELLIVITIIGILASLAIPRFTGQTEKARVAEAVNILSAIRRGQEVYYNENGSYQQIVAFGGQNNESATWAKIGMASPQSAHWYFGTATNNNTAYAQRRTGLFDKDEGCNANNPKGIIKLDLAPPNPIPDGYDPWSKSDGCYVAGQPYHPAR